MKDQITGPSFHLWTYFPG